MAAINAAATQAALDASGTKPTPEAVAAPAAVRRTAGRYALVDFAIERT